MAVVALIDRLAPYVEKELKAAMNSEQEAAILLSKLKKVQLGLLEAEKQGATNPSVRNWLKEVEEVMFEMEDLLDEWEALNPSEDDSPSNLWESLKDKSASNTWDKVVSAVLSICSCFKPVFDGRREISLNMITMSDTLDKILLEERNKYNFTSGESNHPRSPKLDHVESSSGLDHSQEYSGREVDQERLLSKLVPEGEETTTGTQIISITGVGGVGKTTLAQLVFNHEKVLQYFDVRAWAFVGDPFEPTKVAAAILEDLDKSKNASNKPSTLNSLEKCIEDNTSGKKFLVVLDDVWTEERIKWSQLKKCLIKGAPGSKILVTTRNEAVARMMETTHWQTLGLLCDEDCATILNRIALKERSEEDQSILRNIGQEIAKKCNGLPLAANAVGSMLASKSTQQQWLQVLRSPLWEYENEVSDIYSILKLSYLDLDPILKRCFLSCILYSKGYQIPLCELVRMWLGYGYINSSSSEDIVQSKGLEYFEKLKMISFFQKLDDDDDGGTRFKVHDVMQDFAIYMSGIEQISCVIITPKAEGSSDTTGAQHRNFSGKSLEKIRTFWAEDVSQEELPPNLFSVLRRVRGLTVLGCNLQELPSEIGKLIHLRHIDLSWNHFTELPTSVTDLYHLETLDVQGCEQLLRLPQGIEKLRKLRHLLINKTPRLREFPEGLRKLTKLCTLCKFVAGAFGSELGWLENLNELRGSLSIEIVAAADAKDAEKANLRNKTHIRRLELIFDEDVQMELILEALQPPSEIESLHMEGDKCKRFPSWLMDPTSLIKLKKLYIGGFDDSALPPLSKLPSLEELFIYGLGFKLLGCEFFGINKLAAADEEGSSISTLVSNSGFPKLKNLSFVGCRLWEEWEDIGDVQVSLLPCLERIGFGYCVKLEGLPHNLIRSAKALQLLYIHKSELLESRYNLESGSDREKISHIPHIFFKYC